MAIGKAMSGSSQMLNNSLTCLGARPVESEVICLFLELPMYNLSIKIIVVNRTREFFGMIDQLTVLSNV